MYSKVLTKTRYESVIDCSEWAISGYVTSSSSISFNSVYPTNLVLLYVLNIFNQPYTDKFMLMNILHLVLKLMKYLFKGK